MAEITRKRVGELQRGVFKILLNYADGLPAKELLEKLESVVPQTEFEKSEYRNRPGVRRFEKIVRFATIAPVKAGWLTKSKGRWTLTAEGKKAYETIQDPEKFVKEGGSLYRQWAEAIEKAVLHMAIAKSIERSVQEVLCPVRKFGAAPSYRVVAKQGSIVLTLDFPFWLPPPNRDEGWLSTKKSQRELREGFARYLEQQHVGDSIKRQLPVWLTKYLLQNLNRKKYSLVLQKSLARIPQRFLAGRKAYKSDKGLRAATKTTVIAVQKWVDKLATTIKTQHDKFATDKEVTAYLERRLKSQDKIRVQSFFELVRRLPRRRYISADGDAIEGDGPVYAKLSRPQDWDIKRISASIAQREIIDSTGTQPPLKLLETALNRHRKRASQQ